MTYAAEAAVSGKRPVTVVEIDLDLCSKVYGSSYQDTVVAFNDQMLTQSEEFDGTDWTLNTVAGSLVASASTPPTGANATYTLSDPDAGDTAFITQTITGGGPIVDATQHMFSACFLEGTAVYCNLRVVDSTGWVTRGAVDYAWVAGSLTVLTSITGTGSVENLGGGWWKAKVLTTALTAASDHQMSIGVCRTPTTGGIADTGAVDISAAMLHSGTTALEYQYEDARDSSETNIRLTTGGRTVDADIGDYAHFPGSGTDYAITDNGVGYIRVTGDATGEGVAADLGIDALNTLCGASGAAGSECYNTRATCQSAADYSGTGTLTCRFCEPRLSAAEQVEIAAIPSVRSCSLAPAVMEIGSGLGQRGTVTVTFQDHPHHDRGIDPYVATRSYTPEAQGTYWGKLRARNPYYQGRELRAKVGFVTDPIDLTNNFITHHYLLERIEGPDSKGIVKVTAKDVLKLADDERAQCPEASPGVLDAAIDDNDMALTLSPAGIGDSDYPASGTIRIGSECMTFTRVADAVTITERPTDGTTAAAHDAGETVQLCARWTAATLDDVLYDLLVTYAGVAAAYIDTAAWETEVTDWLSGHSVTALITEPTGVRALINELCEQYLVALWWDDVDEEIDIKVLAPSTLTFDSLTDANAIVADSVQVEDDPSKRLSQVWVYYDIIDPTGSLDEAQNFRTVYAYADADAESTAQFGEQRIVKHFSRWFTNEADAMRLGARKLMRLRDNPRIIQFALSAADDYQPGDVVELTTSAITGADGDEEATKVEITECKDIVPGHTRAYKAEEYAFEGRYFMIAPDSAPDYSAATEAQKLIYGYICPDTGEFTDGTEGYKIV